MALISCPECNQPISDKALNCPKCGHPIKKSLKINSPKIKKANTSDENSVVTESSDSIQCASHNKRNINKLVLLLALTIIAIATILLSLLFKNSQSVKEITINKWVLTDSTSYYYSYDGTVESEQKKPFIAIIGETSNDKETPALVYMENGTGIIKTYEYTDEAPSEKYKGIGFLNGDVIEKSDLTINYNEYDYSDYSTLNETTCFVSIDLELDSSKTGLLIFDIINNTTNETIIDMTTVIFKGKGNSIYYVDLPYKSRGVDISVIPKLFCESKPVTESDFTSETPYTSKKEDNGIYKSYSGEQVLNFSDFDNGCILYTKELKKGGNSKNLNIVKSSWSYLESGRCTLSTYDSSEEDSTIFAPKYDLRIIGYLPFIPLERSE